VIFIKEQGILVDRLGALKIKSELFWAAALFLLLILILMPGIPYWLVLVPFFVIFLLVSIKYPSVGLLILAFSHSFSGLIRWKDQEVFLLAGFSTLLAVIFLLSAVTRGLVWGRFKLPIKNDDLWPSKLIFSILFLLLLLLTFNILSQGKGALTNVMMFREYILPLLIFPIAVSIFSERPRECKVILNALFVGSAIIAFVNIIHYVFDLPIARSRWVMQFEGATGLATEIPELRLIFGIPVPRMNHLLGLSGASAGGVYFITMGILGYFLLKSNSLGAWRRTLYFGCFVSLIAAILTVSLAVIVAILFVIVYLVSMSKKGRKATILVFCGMVTMPFLLLLLPALNEQNPINLAQNYVYEVWDGLIYPMLSKFDSILLGDGLGLKSGGAIGVADFANEKYAQLTDQWFFVALYQLGLIGFILTIATIVVPFWIIREKLRKEVDKSISYVVLAAGIVVAGFAGFSHGAAPIERLFSLPLFLVIAIIVSMPYKNLANFSSERVT
jgi:hypothetical protein